MRGNFFKFSCALLFTACFLNGVCAYAIPIESCRIEEKNYQTRLLDSLYELEAAYLRYRWTESQIRRLYYESIWEARILGNDPLSRQKRSEGQDLEKKHIEALKNLHTQSERSSNDVGRQLQALRTTEESIHAFCSRRDVLTCLRVAYSRLDQKIDSIETLFRTIFENERTYREQIENASGGRDGLYPEDALENEHDHSDFYWRFEQNRAHDRFQEDQELMRLSASIRHQLENESVGEECCRQCV